MMWNEKTERNESKHIHFFGYSILDLVPFPLLNTVSAYAGKGKVGIKTIVSKWVYWFMPIISACQRLSKVQTSKFS